MPFQDQDDHDWKRQQPIQGKTFEPYPKALLDLCGAQTRFQSLNNRFVFFS